MMPTLRQLCPGLLGKRRRRTTLPNSTGTCERSVLIRVLPRATMLRVEVLPRYLRSYLVLIVLAVLAQTLSIRPHLLSKPSLWPQPRLQSLRLRLQLRLLNSLVVLRLPAKRSLSGILTTGSPGSRELLVLWLPVCLQPVLLLRLNGTSTIGSSSPRLPSRLPLQVPQNLRYPLLLTMARLLSAPEIPKLAAARKASFHCHRSRMLNTLSSLTIVVRNRSLRTLSIPLR